MNSLVNSALPLTSFTSEGLLTEELILTLPQLTNYDAILIGQIATSLGLSQSLPIAIELQIGDQIIYHASLPGTNKENDSWLMRKARVVKLKQHSTMYEQVLAAEMKLDWHKENNLTKDTHALEGGGLALFTKQAGFVGILLISGLPQIEDHLFGVSVLTEFLARKGELL